MRLTRKTMFGDYAIEVDDCDNFEESFEKVRNTAINKVGRLEDKEEELGIDLDILLNVLKQGYIYYNVPRAGIQKFKVDLFDYKSKQLLSKQTFTVDGEEYNTYLGVATFSGYKKRWALTEGELLCQ